MGSGRRPNGNRIHENSKERMVGGGSTTPQRGVISYNENMPGGHPKIQGNDPYLVQQQNRAPGHHNSGSMVSEAIRDTTIGLSLIHI